MHTSNNNELPKITAAVETLVRSLAPHYVWELVRLLGRDFDSPQSRRGITAQFPNSAARDQVEQFMIRLEGHSNREIALALSCAVSVAETLRHEQSIEVVWTGPETANVSIRRSAAVLLEIVEQAKREVVLLSYAAFKIPDLLSALRRSCERGVNVHLVLESDRDSGGRLSISGANAFEGLRGLATFYVWPADQRPPGAVMHAKCVVADGTCALITSANLTAHAIDINMELGLVVRGGDVPRRLRSHLLALIEGGVFHEVPAV